MTHLFDGFRALDRTFWRWYFKDPMGQALLKMVIVMFFADLLWFFLTPKEVRADRWNEP